MDLDSNLIVLLPEWNDPAVHRHDPTAFEGPPPGGPCFFGLKMKLKT